MSGLMFNGKKNETFRVKIGNARFERKIPSVSHPKKFYSKKHKNVSCE